MYVASARVPESACMRELLGLYLLYRLTWHRMAKLRTVKSGVQAPKDGAARASCLRCLETGGWRLETGCVNADYSHTRAGALPRGLASQPLSPLSALDRARVGCCDRGQLAASWPADQWRWSRGCNEPKGSSAAQWACLHRATARPSPWFTSCTVAQAALTRVTKLTD